MSIALRGAIAILIAIAGLVHFANPDRAAACDFEEPPPPQEALEDATAVFSGEVRSIEPVDDDPGNQFIAATIDVDRAWKGIDSTPVVVETHQDQATCGFPFEEGESYIVYARAEGTPLTTALYHRTQLLERADEDLEVLGEGTEVSEEAAAQNESVDEFNVGILILVAVVISIIVATVMLLRQSKPGLPEDYGDDDDFEGAGDDDPEPRRD